MDIQTQIFCIVGLQLLLIIALVLLRYWFSRELNDVSTSCRNKTSEYSIQLKNGLALINTTYDNLNNKYHTVDLRITSVVKMINSLTDTVSISNTSIESLDKQIKNNNSEITRLHKQVDTNYKISSDAKTSADTTYLKLDKIYSDIASIRNNHHNLIEGLQSTTTELQNALFDIRSKLDMYHKIIDELAKGYNKLAETNNVNALDTAKLHGTHQKDMAELSLRVDNLTTLCKELNSIVELLKVNYESTGPANPPKKANRRRKTN